MIITSCEIRENACPSTVSKINLRKKLFQKLIGPRCGSREDSAVSRVRVAGSKATFRFESRRSEPTMSSCGKQQRRLLAPLVVSQCTQKQQQNSHRVHLRRNLLRGINHSISGCGSFNSKDFLRPSSI